MSGASEQGLVVLAPPPEKLNQGNLNIEYAELPAQSQHESPRLTLYP